MYDFFANHKKTFFAVVFLILYSTGVAFATTPTNQTLDPQCLPTDPTCVVPGGAAGTVTSFAFTNANGFTGSVSNSTATPTLSLTLQNATTAQSGQLTSVDWNTFNDKFAAPAGTTLQYIRGDGSLATLNTTIVPEGTNLYYTTARANTDFDTRLATKSTTNLAEGSNLYFTNGRAIGSTLTGYTSGAGTVSSSDTVLGAIQKLNGNVGALVTGVSSVNSLTGAVAITGTANRLTISGANVFDISSSYVGQLSITTLGTITTGVWNGTAIANANLANNSLTIGSTNIALGAISTTLAGLTSVTSTGFTGALTGNASTATALQTARTINGTSFDGTGNITVTAAAGTLTGTTLNSTVVSSSLTSVGTIATGTWNGSLLTGTYGGTGVNNGSNTITIAGNLITTGAFNTTFAASATATYTLPTATATLLANNLGISGGSTLVGGTASGDNLTLLSTSNATKGNIYLNPLSSGATAGSVFIGRSSTDPLPISGDPVHQFGIVNDNTTMQMFSMWAVGTGASLYQNNMHFYRSRGTIASPTAIQSGDFMVSMGFRGYDGSAMSQSAGAYQVVAPSNWTTSNHEARFQWEVTPSASTTRSRAMQLNGDGSLYLTNNSSLTPYRTITKLVLDGVGYTSSNFEMLIQSATTNGAGIILGESTSAESYIVRYPSALSGGGSYTGTSINFATSTNIRSGGTSNNTLVLGGTPIVNLVGTTTTNMGTRLDTTGLKIDQIQNLSTAPTYALEVINTATSGVVARFKNSGGTCDHTPGAAAEVVTCTSDRRFKTNIDAALPALDDLNKFSIKQYDSLLDGTHYKYGVIAQEMLAIDPSMVHIREDGFYGVEEVSSWKIVKAIQELDIKIAGLAAMDSSSNALRGNLVSWLGNIENGIHSIFVKDIHVENRFCIGEKDQETCITKSQLDVLLQLVPAPAVQPTATVSPIDVPVIEAEDPRENNSQ
jgi:hypothetical protein